MYQSKQTKKENKCFFHFGIQEINKHILSSAAVLSSIQIKPTFLQLSSFRKLFCVLDFLIVFMNFVGIFLLFRFIHLKRKPEHLMKYGHVTTKINTNDNNIQT